MVSGISEPSEPSTVALVQVKFLNIHQALLWMRVLKGYMVFNPHKNLHNRWIWNLESTLFSKHCRTQTSNQHSESHQKIIYITSLGFTLCIQGIVNKNDHFKNHLVLPWFFWRFQGKRPSGAHRFCWNSDLLILINSGKITKQHNIGSLCFYYATSQGMYFMLLLLLLLLLLLILLLLTLMLLSLLTLMLI